MQNIDLAKLQDGTFGTEEIQKQMQKMQGSSSNLPMIDPIAIQGIIQQHAHELGKAQVQTVKAQAAGMMLAVQAKGVQTVINAHMALKMAEPGNRNFIRVNATPKGVYSSQETPFWNFTEHVIDLVWDE